MCIMLHHCNALSIPLRAIPLTCSWYAPYVNQRRRVGSATALRARCASAGLYRVRSAFAPTRAQRWLAPPRTPPQDLDWVRA